MGEKLLTQWRQLSDNESNEVIVELNRWENAKLNDFEKVSSF